jgi:hypothetical protein
MTLHLFRQQYEHVNDCKQVNTKIFLFNRILGAISEANRLNYGNALYRQRFAHVEVSSFTPFACITTCITLSTWSVLYLNREKKQPNLIEFGF